jgi:hypothetical protein
VVLLENGGLSAERLKKLGNGVLQERLRQHAFFDAIVPGPVATVRFTSVFTGARAEVRAVYLRVGRAGEKVVGSATNLRIPVDRATGELGGRCYLPDWSSVENHPDTGFRFAGNRIPRFEECISTVQGLHARFPHVTSIGWDVCVPDDGRIRVMEWNGTHNDIKFSEATTGPCFADLGWENLWRGGSADVAADRRIRRRPSHRSTAATLSH